MRFIYTKAGRPRHRPAFIDNPKVPIFVKAGICVLYYSSNVKILTYIYMANKSQIFSCIEYDDCR